MTLGHRTTVAFAIAMISLMIYLKLGYSVTIHPISVAIGAALCGAPAFFYLLSAFKYEESFFTRPYNRQDDPFYFWMNVAFQSTMLFCVITLLYFILMTDVLGPARVFRLEE